MTGNELKTLVRLVVDLDELLDNIEVNGVGEEEIEQLRIMRQEVSDTFSSANNIIRSYEREARVANL